MGAQPRRRRLESIRSRAGRRREHGVGRLDALAARRPAQVGQRQVGAPHVSRSPRRSRSSGPPKACIVSTMPASTSSPAGVRPGPRPPSSRATPSTSSSRSRSRTRPSRSSQPARAERSAPGSTRQATACPPTTRRRPRRHRPDVDAGRPELQPAARHHDVVADGDRREPVHTQVQRAGGARTVDDHEQPAELDVDGVGEDRPDPTASRPAPPSTPPRRRVRSRRQPAVEGHHGVDEAGQRRGGDAGADLPGPGGGVEDAGRDLRRDAQLDDAPGVDAERRAPAVEDGDPQARCCARHTRGRAPRWSPARRPSSRRRRRPPTANRPPPRHPSRRARARRCRRRRAHSSRGRSRRSTALGRRSAPGRRATAASRRGGSPNSVPLRAMVVTIDELGTSVAHPVNALAAAIATVRKMRWLPARNSASGDSTRVVEGGEVGQEVAQQQVGARLDADVDVVAHLQALRRRGSARRSARGRARHRRAGDRRRRRGSAAARRPAAFRDRTTRSRPVPGSAGRRHGSRRRRSRRPTPVATARAPSPSARRCRGRLAGSRANRPLRSRRVGVGDACRPSPRR